MQYVDFSWKQSMSLFQTIYCACRNVCGIVAPVITKQAIPKWTASISENVGKGRKDINYLVTWMLCFNVPSSWGHLSVPPGEEEAEGRCHCSYNFLVSGRPGTDLFSWWPVIGPKRMAWSCIRVGLVWFRKRFLSQRVVGYWNRLPREMVSGT